MTIKKIKESYVKFHESKSSDLTEQIANLPKGQSPEVLMITCSDSRIEPAMLFGSDPGDVFTIRNAGNIVSRKNKENLGTIQFAVDVLKVKHIVICGHTDCGAVKGMLDISAVKGLDCLENWLTDCECGTALESDAPLTNNVKSHVLNQVDVLNGIDFVKAKVASNELTIHGWVLDLGTYNIEACDQSLKNWVDLSEYGVGMCQVAV